MKIATKKEIIDWYNSQPDYIRDSLIIERYLEASSKSCVYLKIEEPNGRAKTIFKIGRKGLRLFNLTFADSAYINVCVYKVHGLNGDPIVAQIANSSAG